MTEVTQSLVVPCERPTFAHLRALRDLATFPEAAQAILSCAGRFFNFSDDVVYSGYARTRDDFDSPIRDAPDFTIQVWHGETVYRTMLVPNGYVGILHVQIPEHADPNDYFVLDRIGEKCRRMQRFDLAPACLGHIYAGNLMLEVPNIPEDPLWTHFV